MSSTEAEPSDISYPAHGRVAALCGALTADEAASLTAGSSMWRGTAVPRLNIPGFKVTDGPAGARGSFWTGTTSASAPCGTALAATWNVDLVHQVGRVLGEEASTKGANMLLAPTVNLHRHPLAGRNFECYSEDPRLTATLAVAYIQGVQAVGVSACVKHLVANDQEFKRHTISAEVDEQTLRQLYLLPFEAAVISGRVGSIMTGYNRLNGQHCAEHRWLLTELLTGEWGFDGLVISDWWGVASSDETRRNGMHVEMPGPAVYLGPTLNTKDPEVEADARRMARAVLEHMHRWDVTAEELDQLERSVNHEAHRDTLRTAAQQAIVLLKNDPADDGTALLPLTTDREYRTVVIGPNALSPMIQGGGSAAVVPHYFTDVVDVLRAALPGSVSAEIGCIPQHLPPMTSRSVRRPSDGSPGFDIELFATLDRTGASIGMTSTSQARVIFEGAAAPGIDAIAKSAILRADMDVSVDGDHHFSLVTGEFGRLIVDGTTLIDNHADREPGTMFFQLGSAERRATIPLRAGTTISIELQFAGFDGLPLSAFQIGYLPPTPADVAEAAVLAAQESDVAIVVLGLTPDLETEGADRTSMRLPQDQLDLISRVAAVNPNTIAVVNAGAPVEMGWAESVPAVLQCWYLGQEQGHAIADVLTGSHNPSGRLPMTIPVTIEDTPAFANYPGDTTVAYEERLNIGYRHFVANGVGCAYPFGFGLSYSTFAIASGQLDILMETVDGSNWAQPAVAIDVSVTNTGERFGAEVVQAYLIDRSGADIAPIALAGFARVETAPGESAHATIQIPARHLCVWDLDRGGWKPIEGEIDLAIGRNVEDVEIAWTITVHDGAITVR